MRSSPHQPLRSRSCAGASCEAAGPHGGQARQRPIADRSVWECLTGSVSPHTGIDAPSLDSSVCAHTPRAGAHPQLFSTPRSGERERAYSSWLVIRVGRLPHSCCSR